MTVSFAAQAIGWWCAAMSIAAFIAYGVDKSAASRHRRRVSERTLHLLALFGGWPGALFAQPAFRHKTMKRSFRGVFWLTVLVNCAAIAAILWASGASA